MNTQNNPFLKIGNNGPLIRETNFWETQIAKQGFLFLSFNAGAARLLVPENHEYLRDMTTSEYAILTRGRWNGQPSYELLFEDNSDSPYMVFMNSSTFDRMLPESEAGSDLPLLVYVRGEEHPVIASRKPARYRVVAKLPCMKPITFAPVIPDGPLSQKTGADS